MYTCTVSQVDVGRPDHRAAAFTYFGAPAVAPEAHLHLHSARIVDGEKVLPKMSSSLMWQVTRVSTSRTSRRTHPKVAMTREKGSLRNVRKFADSGFCNVRAVDVDANDYGIPVLSLKNAKATDSRKPEKMWTSMTLSGGVRKALAKTDRALAMYRPAARKHAMHKVSAIYKALARKQRGITHASVKAGRTVDKGEE